ncbi:signal peptidase I [Streptomyces sp. NPDC006385]|uniref:signal peptidase I n=1 Tax=Streptomyces sp. NPDC006385 TaxID=3156761 RepID=UPI0033A0A75F
MSGKGRGLGIAAVAVGLVGLLLGLGGFAYARHTFGGSVVSSESMTPTYGPGDRIVYERVDGSDVRRGDVVVFSAPDRYGFGGLVMGRVIGVGGDHVTCCTGAGADTRVSVNGEPLQEPYLKNPEASRGFGMASYDVRVPEGRLFLLGDHRANSRDARAFLDDRGGTLPESAIRGRVLEDYTVPGVVGTAMILGGLLVLVGVGLGIAAVVVRQRARAMMPPPPPWAVRV